MSQFLSTLNGGKTVIKKMRVGITISNVGVPLIGATANNEGVLLGTTTTSADALGMNLDTATYNTGQQTDGSDPSETVSVVVNSDAIWRTRLCGSASVEGTALTKYYNTVASATGVLLTPSASSGGSTVDMSAVDDTLFFCYSGANAGLVRRAEPADGTDVNFTQAFRYAIAVDDLFIVCPITPGAVQFATFTTNLYEYDAVVSTTLNTTPTWRAYDVELYDIGTGKGLTDSAVHLICADHAYAGSALA